ncbi:MAG TPA: lysylphosphatidylglycerol synthase transmembrane domain-containing protein [Terriglobales bacterium]|nr:lysylphosphatidylglycerol synthase transmembrane domain-containing protein [Terriglobales bacterium]
MKKKYVVYAVVFVVLAILVYMQFRTWQNFDWARFRETRPQNWFHIAHGVALIYLAYVVRAIRWKIFLRPVRPKASAVSLIAPTMIGFTGLALLGRPGELIRPYLIARRQDLPFSSQLAVWAIERIFDIGAFTVLLVCAIFLAEGPRELPLYHAFQKGGVFLAALVVGMVLGAMAVHAKGEGIAKWVEQRFSHLPAHLGQKIALRVREFRDGLNTIHGPLSLFAVTVLSLAMWFMIIIAYQDVAHSYMVDSLEIQRSQVLVLMGASMIGSLVQLPGIGGGSQLATIATLQRVFDVPKELAASCGIMLWLVTFVAIVPVGLLLAHRERLSLRKLSEETAEADESEAVSPAS